MHPPLRIDQGDAEPQPGSGNGLEIAAALFPDEVAAASRLAVEEAVAIKAAAVKLADPPSASSFPADRDASGRRAGDQPQARPAAVRCASDEAAVHYWSLATIGAAFANGSLTPPALLAALLDRIDAIDHTLDSFVALDRTGAMVAAQASAARWAAGAPLGPLDGIPTGIKDVIDVAGLPTRCHSRVTADAPALRDADIVARLRAAGAVIIGKLATHEFAIGGPAFDLPFPPARNPWNRDHHPGGSSSGAGAAVAAGLVPLAIGTDTAGSVRNPASACGIVGLKPGRGVLPVGGVVPLAPTLDHVGLLTRSVDDITLAASALGIDVTPAQIGRVGYVRHFHINDMTATPETAAALDRAAAALDAVEVTLPPLGEFALVNRIILQAEGYVAHGRHLHERPEDLSYLTRTALLPGAFITPETLALAMQARAALTEAVDAAFAQVDILLTASSMEPACRIDDKAEIARTYMLQARSPFNVTGHPALAMGAGLSANSLPLSLQFVARRGEEERLLAAAAAWEAAMGEPMAPVLDDVSA